MRGERPNIKKKDLAEAPDNFVKLMEVCWDIDPKKRPTFDEIFEQLKQLNNDVIYNCESPWQMNEFYGKGDNKIDVLIATDGVERVVKDSPSVPATFWTRVGRIGRRTPRKQVRRSFTR